MQANKLPSTFFNYICGSIHADLIGLSYRIYYEYLFTLLHVNIAELSGYDYYTYITNKIPHCVNNKDKLTKDKIRIKNER